MFTYITCFAWLNISSTIGDIHDNSEAISKFAEVHEAGNFAEVN